MGYGIDIASIDSLIFSPEPVVRPWGRETPIFSRDEFAMRRLDISAGKDFLLDTGTGEATVFVESGVLEAGGAAVDAGHLVSVAAGEQKLLSAAQDSVAYVFSGPQDPSFAAVYDQAQPTSDVREKYWGRIESVVSRAYAGKRLLVNTDKHSSMEYHCDKTEGYYIHSGTLLVRVRAGRAEEKVFELSAGQAMLIPRGLMHQRGGRHDAVIMEVSTKDDDADSFLVEDGQTTPMPGLLKP